MNENRGPVIFAALVTCSLILAWVTLLSFERFGATEVRSWTPVLQAVLSAGAIYAAWWFQDMKRRADRAEAMQDNITAISELMRIVEWQVARALSVSGPEDVYVKLLMVIGSPIENALLMLRQQKPALLPNTQAVGAYVAMTHQAAMVCSLLDAHIREAGDNKLAKSVETHLTPLYGNIRFVRDIFLEAVGSAANTDRPPAETSALRAWREEADKSEDVRRNANALPDGHG